MKKFILGAGAQKSGTTWLYEQFARQDNFKPPATKELHVFDAIYLRDVLPFGDAIGQKMAELIQKAPKNYKFYFLTKRFQMFLDPDVYFKYFDDIISDENSFSCDLTPTHSGLSAEVFEFIKSKFQQFNIKTSVAFLMREPVSRLESEIKMNLRKAGTIDTTTASDMMAILKKRCGSPQDKVRSSYGTTVGRINSVFDERQVFIGFYETLFTRPEQERVAATFDLNLEKIDAKTKVNHTAKSFTYPKDFIEDLRSNYEDEYKFAYGEMGLDEAIWEQKLKNLYQ